LSCPALLGIPSHNNADLFKKVVAFIGNDFSVTMPAVLDEDSLDPTKNNPHQVVDEIVTDLACQSQL